MSDKPFYAVELEAGKKYSWCTCGKTETEPFCDGSHKQDPELPKSTKFYPEETKTYFLCGCKKTQNPPFCDGSHSKCQP